LIGNLRFVFETVGSAHCNQRASKECCLNNTLFLVIEVAAPETDVKIAFLLKLQKLLR